MCRSFVLLVGFLLAGPSCTNSDNLGLLLDTLKPVYRAVCEDQEVALACPTGTAISILVAQYGGDPPKGHTCATVADQMCKLPNKMQYMLLQRVVEVCQKKNNCTFSTNPGLGDPCPTLRKFVQVEYKCRPTEFRSIRSCDEEDVRISCNPNSRITIYDVRYGRIAHEPDSCPQPHGVPDETCVAPYAVETVMRFCHGKRRCHFTANRDTFDVSCKSYSKPYIKIVFACVPLGVLTERYESAAENDEVVGAGANVNPYDETDGAVQWREPIIVPPYADPALQSPTEGVEISSTSKAVVAVYKPTSKDKDKRTNYNIFVYIGAGIILIILLVLLIIGIRCYFTRKEKEHAKNGDMFSTEAPNVFSDIASEMDNDAEVSHISGTFYDPVHPDMILYRDADGTRNTLRAMRPLSTIYPCAGARMYGNVDYVPQREPARFTRSRSKEEEPTVPEVMTSPKSLGAYSTSQFYYG